MGHNIPRPILGIREQEFAVLPSFEGETRNWSSEEETERFLYRVYLDVRGLIQTVHMYSELWTKIL